VRTDEWIRQAEGRLREIADSPRLEAQLLAGHVLRVDRPWLLAHPEHEFNELAGEGLLQRREGHEPLAYILGSREFYGRRFRVSPAVLIPRQDTEILVETALSAEGGKVLDIGTGSGAIAVTLKLERPGWTVTGVDISRDALEIARDNAEILGADVRFIESDGFKALGGEKFDLIVSNPPYIGVQEDLAREVRDFEPSLALFSGDTGLEFYARLAIEAENFLQDRGQILLEVGYRQAAAVREIFEGAGWGTIDTVKDLSGVERVVVFHKVS